MKTKTIEMMAPKTYELKYQDKPAHQEKGPYVCFANVDGYWRPLDIKPHAWTIEMFDEAHRYYNACQAAEREAKHPVWEVTEYCGGNFSIKHKGGTIPILLGDKADVDALIVALCKFKYSGE